jgi:hypothetical protein
MSATFNLAGMVSTDRQQGRPTDGDVTTDLGDSDISDLLDRIQSQPA